MKFSSIAIFAFVFTVDIWAIVNDIKHYRSGTDEHGQPSTPKRRTVTKVNIAIDFFLLVVMLGYLLFEFQQLRG